MDIFSHLLWAYLVFPQNSYKYAAMIAAIIPDFIPAFPFFIYLVAKGKVMEFWTWEKGVVRRLPNELHYLYRCLHSLPILAGLFILLYFIGINSNYLIFALFGWLFHISVDIVFHNKKYGGVQFLFPFSTFSFSIFNWASPGFFVANYAILAFSYAVRFI